MLVVAIACALNQWPRAKYRHGSVLGLTCIANRGVLSTAFSSTSVAAGVGAWSSVKGAVEGTGDVRGPQRAAGVEPGPGPGARTWQQCGHPPLARGGRGARARPRGADLAAVRAPARVL
jgi:hypothetical protein